MHRTTRSLVHVVHVVLLCLSFVACRAHVSTKAPVRPSNPHANDGPRLEVGPEDASRGSANAYVTLVLFSDFRCSLCQQLWPTIDRLRAAYPADTLRVVFKHHPSQSLAYAKLLSTVAQGVFEVSGMDAFVRYRDLALRNADAIGPEPIRGWALTAGLTAGELDRGLERGAWADKVERDVVLAHRLGASEPPVSFVNGVSVRGAQSFELLRDVVDVELAKAKLLEQSGVPRVQIYDRAVASNLSDPRISGDRSELDDPQAVWRVKVGTSPVRGKATALVTIVEFSSFDCAACKRMAESLEKVRLSHGDRVRIVWKDAPPTSHPKAIAAAYLARAARSQKGDVGFWEMHDRIFASPRLENSDLEVLARTSGLDVASAMATIREQKAKNELAADLELGEDVEVGVAPQTFVNGRRLIGEQPLDRITAVVEEEVKKADALLRSGIDPMSLYEWFIKDGQPIEPFKKNIPLNPNAPFKGTVNGPLVIQEFSEMPCAPCRRAEPMLDELMRTYAGSVKLAWRDLPTAAHPDAPLAAEAAREAYAQKGNDGFWRMQAQIAKNPLQVTRSDLESYAKELGFDVEKFKRALDGHVHKAAVDADAKVAIENGITVTPTFVVGQYVLGGVPGLARFLRFGGRALAEAPKPIAASSPRGPGVSGPVKFSATDLVVGTGREAHAGDTISIHYRGKLLDGKEFDSTYRRGPYAFVLGKGFVIQAWDRGIEGMKVGGRRRVVVPPEMGFGNHGVGQSIPPGTAVVFDIELLSVE